MLVRAVYNQKKQKDVLINHFGPNKICRNCKNKTQVFAYQ